MSTNEVAYRSLAADPAAPDRLPPARLDVLRGLCWALVVFVIGGAIVNIGLSQDLFAARPAIPETADFVDRLVAIRGFDQSVYPIVLVGSLLSIGTFAVIGLLGAAIRPLARATSTRDVMMVVFVIAGVVGIASQLVNIAAAQEAASITYCDCGYRTEEVIAQARVVNMGFAIQSWLNLGAVALLAVAAALAGRLLSIGGAWTTLSYVIAIALLTGVVLRFLDFGKESDLLVGIVAAIAVPVWAFLLARGARTEANSAEC